MAWFFTKKYEREYLERKKRAEMFYKALKDGKPVMIIGYIRPEVKKGYYG